MRKDRRHSYLSSERCRASPYSRRSKHPDQCRSKNNLPSIGDEKEWEEARCAICMEHPHNAVLLLCSSHEKGCRPYMCDTSHRHSNCLDQFCKSSPAIKAMDLGEDFSRLNNFKQLEHKLPCPLCRGQISGWMVVEPARSFMNLKPRSCSLESCLFIGTYSELRAHARREHPSLCPTEVDPTRQEEWTRLENETTFQDLLGVSRLENELSDNTDLFHLDNYSPFFQHLESDSEWDGMLEQLEMDFELELPFTFIDMPSFHSDPFCPYRLTVDHSQELSYQPRTGESNNSTREPDNRTRGYSSRRSNSRRGQRQPDRRL